MEQITLDMYMASVKPPEYGARGCHVCFWHNFDPKDEGCHWNSKVWKWKTEEQKYPDCSFMPDDKYFHMCANCEHANNSVHQNKPEYAEAIKKSWNGYCKKANEDPLEEPNIYCTHPEGSLNRHTAYKDIERPNFGVGHWHRQHEWDTCDRWEKERPWRP